MQLNPDDCTLKPSTNQDAETAGILKAGPPKDKVRDAAEIRVHFTSKVGKITCMHAIFSFYLT